MNYPLKITTQKREKNYEYKWSRSKFKRKNGNLNQAEIQMLVT